MVRDNIEETLRMKMEILRQRMGSLDESVDSDSRLGIADFLKVCVN
jgi:hypothetical protein